MAEAPSAAAATPGTGAPETGRVSEAQIRDLVTRFYGRIRTDPVLAPFFEDRLAGRWDEHLTRMSDFWASVLLGARRFTGDPVGRHTGLPGLAPRHYPLDRPLRRDGPPGDARAARPGRRGPGPSHAGRTSGGRLPGRRRDGRTTPGPGPASLLTPAENTAPPRG